MKLIQVIYWYCLVFTICYASAQTVYVNTATELQTALNNASPGQTIELADGVYQRSGGFYANAGLNGTLAQPITVHGSSKAIISSNNLNTGYGFALKGNSYWILDGFTVWYSKKGIVLDNSHHNTLQNINVKQIGDEGIHLRTYSSFNTINNCFVDSTGLVSTGTGEGIYIGSATSNWATYTAGNPDTCNYNTITYCRFGDLIVSENIDIKEGTSHGIISFNQFNGKGLNGENYADSWVDVKGNDYTLSCNTGQYTLTDGFQSHINAPGYGDYNTFYGNDLIVNTSGYGINIATSSSNGTATHNVVCNSNSASGAASGLSNLSTQTCSENCTVTGFNDKVVKDDFILYPNPATHYIRLKLAANHINASFKIFNSRAQVQLEGVLTDETLVMLYGWPNGLYLLQVEGIKQPLRFMKQE